MATKPKKFDVAIIKKVADLFPNWAKYILGALLVGMVICQALGYHTFTPDEWGMVEGQ